MYRLLTLSMGTLLLAAGLVLAIPVSPAAPATLQCTLTGQKLEQCCCEQREGKLYCPLAKKTINQCCCKSLGAYQKLLGIMMKRIS